MQKTTFNNNICPKQLIPPRLTEPGLCTKSHMGFSLSSPNATMLFQNSNLFSLLEMANVGAEPGITRLKKQVPLISKELSSLSVMVAMILTLFHTSCDYRSFWNLVTAHDKSSLYWLGDPSPMSFSLGHPIMRILLCHLVPEGNPCCLF